jgi:chromatin assembly factor 1 subunit B
MLHDLPQITWHGGEKNKNDPILSCDCHPLLLRHNPAAAPELPAPEHGQPEHLLATAGADGEIRLWAVRAPSSAEALQWDTIREETSMRLQRFLLTVGSHEDIGINAVRFSPNGLHLVSAGDRGIMIVWSVDTPEGWADLGPHKRAARASLSGCSSDIYDVAWSPDSKYLVSGSLDKRMLVWDIEARKIVSTLQDHQHFVQVSLQRLNFFTTSVQSKLCSIVCETR